MEFDLLTTLSNETYLIIPVYSDQVVRFNGQRHVTVAGVPIMVYGTGPVLINKGSTWSKRARFAGTYTGPYFDGNSQSTVSAEFLDIQRRIGDGPWITLARDLALTDAITDPIPATNGINRYRAISRTSLPTEAIGEEVEFNPGEKQWLYFNHGAGWGQVVRFMGNPAVSQATGRNSAVHAMAGIPYPTSVRGSQLNAHYEVAGTITPDGSQRTDWEALSDTETVVCYRDPANRRVFANINPIPLEGTIIENIGASFDRVHYIEGLLDEES